VKIEPAPFSMIWSHFPKDRSRPCEWRLLNHTRPDPSRGEEPMKAPALIGGACRTYKEARGLLMRIGKACQRAYRYGYLAGYRAGRAHNKPLRVLPKLGETGVFIDNNCADD